MKISAQFIRFLFVGALNTAFGVCVYCLMIYLGLPYTVATLISTVLGILWNFETTGRLVFRSNDQRLIFRFVACYGVTYLINIGVIRLLLLTGLNDYWSGIGATPIVALCSYVLLKNFVFNKKKEK